MATKEITSSGHELLEAAKDARSCWVKAYIVGGLERRRLDRSLRGDELLITTLISRARVTHPRSYSFIFSVWLSLRLYILRTVRLQGI